MEVIFDIRDNIKKNPNLHKCTKKYLKKLWNCPKSESKISAKNKKSKDETDQRQFLSISKDLIIYFLNIAKNDLPEGLFRKSGNEIKTNQLKENLLVQPLETLLKNDDICFENIASALKDFLRKSEIFSDKLKNILLKYLLIGFKNQNEENHEKKLKIAIKLVNLNLPEANQEIFHLLIRMIKHILTSKEIQMDIKGMARIFSTCIFPPDSETLEEYSKSEELMEGFLEIGFPEAQFSPASLIFIHTVLKENQFVNFLKKLPFLTQAFGNEDHKTDIITQYYGYAVRKKDMSEFNKL